MIITTSTLPPPPPSLSSSSSSSSSAEPPPSPSTPSSSSSSLPSVSNQFYALLVQGCSHFWAVATGDSTIFECGDWRVYTPDDPDVRVTNTDTKRVVYRQRMTELRQRYPWVRVWRSPSSEELEAQGPECFTNLKRIFHCRSTKQELGVELQQRTRLAEILREVGKLSEAILEDERCVSFF